MRSRRLALPPSLRIDAQLEMLSSKTPQGTVGTVLAVLLIILRVTRLNRTPARWY